MGEQRPVASDLRPVVSGRRAVNRRMFWRVLRRSLFANRSRLFVILLALGAGSAVTAALLNLQVDAKRRITTEFRAFGANVLVAPKGGSEASGGLGATMSDSLYERIPKRNAGDLVAKASLLYGIAWATPRQPETEKGTTRPIVVVGYEYYGRDLSDIFPSAAVVGGGTSLPATEPVEAPAVPISIAGSPTIACQLGESLERNLHVTVGQWLDLKSGTSELACYVNEVRRFGSAEDGQLFVGLPFAQRLLGRNGQTSLIALNVPGNSPSVTKFVTELSEVIPSVEVRLLRQFTEGQMRVYSRISGILSATVVVVLVLTALCVMAAMTNIAAERKNDVGLMKAIGGSVRRVLRIFLAEAALLGLAGGLLGAAAGIVLSIGLGKAVFGVAARPRLVVYPISVALTIIVAILAAYPLRRLALIRPAAVFRGEE